MANKFQIVISAVDKATATVRKINASLGSLTAPITRMQQATSALGKEIGIDKVGKEIGGVGKAAGNLVGKLGSMLAPMAALVGGGTLAGTAALATEWARLGSEVSRTAQGLDMAASRLMGLRGASALAGLSAQEMTGGLKSIGDTMEDALFGRNQAAMAMLNRLGVGIHKTANGSIDAARGLKDLGNSIAGIKNVQAQGIVARTFGIEALLPLLRKGARGIEEYEQKVAELGGVRSQAAINAAEQFGLRLNFLSVATQGVKDAIGEKLLPILQPLLERFTAWIVKNRELIASKVADFVEGLARWIDRLDFDKIADDIADVCTKIGELISWMGGWKNAALALVIIMNGSLIASVINLGLALTRLSVVAIPAVIRGFGLLAAGAEATLVPALVSTLMSIGSNIAGLAMMAARIPLLGGLLAGVANGFMALAGAIAATPIGWLIAGVVAIGASVYAIYKNWDSIVEYFSKKLSGIKEAFSRSWTEGVVKALIEFNPIKILGDTLNGLTKWLFDFDLYAAGEHMIASLVRGIKGLASKLPKSVLKMIGLDDWATSESPAPKVATQKAAAPQRAAASSASVPMPAAEAPANTARTPLGIRQNNPGNLRTWPGVPSVNGYAQFQDPAAGIAAMAQNLRSYQNKHGINTLAGVISRWAPPSENRTSDYIASMARRTGFDPNAQLNLNDPKTVAPLVSGIIKQENGKQPYSEDMINQIVAAQLNGGAQQQPIEITVHAPAGAKVTARTKNGSEAPVRVSYAMPTAVTP